MNPESGFSFLSGKTDFSFNSRVGSYRTPPHKPPNEFQKLRNIAKEIDNVEISIKTEDIIAISKRVKTLLKETDSTTIKHRFERVKKSSKNLLRAFLKLSLRNRKNRKVKMLEDLSYVEKEITSCENLLADIKRTNELHQFDVESRFVRAVMFPAQQT